MGVGDVPSSFKCYEVLFGQPATLPAHDLCALEGTVAAGRRPELIAANV
jgi:hypothetical protein